MFGSLEQVWSCFRHLFIQIQKMQQLFNVRTNTLFNQMDVLSALELSGTFQRFHGSQQLRWWRLVAGRGHFPESSVRQTLLGSFAEVSSTICSSCVCTERSRRWTSDYTLQPEPLCSELYLCSSAVSGDNDRFGSALMTETVFINLHAQRFIVSLSASCRRYPWLLKEM